jgi:transcription initiation factor TFIID subunit TAF12
MTQQQQQAAMQQQQNGQQPQRPQVNVAQARQPSIQGQTPTSAMPGSAIQQNPQQHQQPQALTHQAAISQAQAHAAAANQQANGQQPHPNGLIYTGPNSGAAHTPHSQNTPTSAHPSGAAQGGNPYGPGQYPTAQQTTNTKFPIPKTLPMDPRTQQPVAGPPSRPTLSNAGAMNQPNIQRAPPYVLEGEGDHVLSKRKLDELVRQVTGSVGGGSAVSADGNKAEGAAGSLLDPDVEESILQVADDFVDAVIVSACRLAKLRPNQTLDIRDVQLVLERNYGIRIPGYALDEVRTVRKFVPSAGWQTKMQAVQAGKVMGNKEA